MIKEKPILAQMFAFFKDFLKTAVETKQTVIETPKICNSTVAIKDAKKEKDRSQK